MTIADLIRKLLKLRKINNHTEAVLLLAKFLKDEQGIKEMTAIQTKANKAGHMEYGWIEERMAIRQRLMNVVLLKYNEDTMIKLNAAF